MGRFTDNNIVEYVLSGNMTLARTLPPRYSYLSNIGYLACPPILSITKKCDSYSVLTIVLQISIISYHNILIINKYVNNQ